MLLANMLSKMKQNTQMGSRIAEVHNGSSLFTGDAGGREQHPPPDHRERLARAIVALPLNMFYNTGIATYVGVTNRKPAPPGQGSADDATGWNQPLGKNLGSKNCELGEADIQRVCEAFLNFEETGQSKILDNADLGYWKVTSSARCASRHRRHPPIQGHRNKAT